MGGNEGVFLQWLLGLTIDDRLSWHDHTKNVCDSFSKKVAVLKQIKAGVNMNRREIWSDIKKEIVRIKMGWKHYQTVDPRTRKPQVARGLFGIRLLILHFKFQFSKSIKSSTFHIFLNLTYPLRKNISFPKCPKLTQKFT